MRVKTGVPPQKTMQPKKHFGLSQNVRLEVCYEETSPIFSNQRLWKYLQAMSACGNRSLHAFFSSAVSPKNLLEGPSSQGI